MKFCLLLHCHQPPTQYPEIIKKVSRQSYERIFSCLRPFPRAKITLNITASLAEQLDPSLVAEIRSLHESEQIELTQTGAYHPLLVYLPDDEVSRQINLNREIIRKIFDFEPGLGFFPPEMAVNDRVLALIKKSGSQWLIVDEEAVVDPDPKHAVFSDQSGFTVVRRNRQLSTAVAFSQIRHLSELLTVVENQKLPILVMAMDGETFGHHRPEQIEFLKEFLALSSSPDHEVLTISEMLQEVEPVKIQKLKASTWGDSFDRWRNPNNPVHQLQWQLYELAIKAVWDSMPTSASAVSNFAGKDSASLSEAERSWLKARSLLDQALHSDQFWWAAKNPCWHYPMLERGADLLLAAVEALSGQVKLKLEAENLQQNLKQTAVQLYGKTIIGC